MIVAPCSDEHLFVPVRHPEQLFAVGYAACFEGALGVAARRAKADPSAVAIDSEVSLSPRR
jgi:osmotically inducible protein OsmC